MALGPVGVAGFLVLVLLFSAWQHFELLRHGYRIGSGHSPVHHFYRYWKA